MQIPFGGPTAFKKNALAFRMKVEFALFADRPYKLQLQAKSRTFVVENRQQIRTEGITTPKTFL
jgi:hypothetical protein